MVAKVCVETHQKSNQALFGIVQGGKYPRLREYSAKYTSSFDLPGIAVGGVSVGEAVEEIHSVITVSYTHLTLPTTSRV